MELLRVWASFMVVLIHTRLIVEDYAAQLGTLKGSTLLLSFSASSVGVFFMITGFFLYRKNMSLIQTGKGYLRKIFLPSMVIMVLGEILYQFLCWDAGLLACIAGADLKEITINLFRVVIGFDTSRLNTGIHLWYIFDYALLIIWLPITANLIRHQCRRAVMYLAFFGILRAVCVDINQFWPFPIAVYLPDFLPKSVLWSLLGYLFYTSIPKKKNRLLAGVSLFCFAVCTLVIYKAQMHQYGLTPERVKEVYFAGWQSGLAQIQGLLICAALIHMPIREGFLAKVISSLGRQSFLVYLLHYYLILKLRSSGLQRQMAGMFHTERWYGSLLFGIAFGLLVYGISLAMAVLIHKLLHLFKSIPVFSNP